MNHSQRSRSAFTLVELLVVVAIIGLLAMLLLGSFNYILMRSETVRCINSMRQIGAALNAYASDHDGWLPPGYPSGGGVDNLVPPEGMRLPTGTLHYFLAGYLTEVRYNASGSMATGDLPYCPGGMGGAARVLDKAELVYRVRGSYGYNSTLQSYKITQFPLPSIQIGGTTISWALKPEKFEASRYPLLLEIRSDGYNLTTWNFVHQNQALNGSFGETGSGWGQISPSRSHGLGDALNFLFMAGNVETIARNDSRSLSAMDKSWTVPQNPKGMFHGTGEVPGNVAGRTVGEKIYFEHGGSGLSPKNFRLMYPQFSSYEGP